MGECGPMNPKRFTVFRCTSGIYKPFKCLTSKNMCIFQHANLENVHRLWCWHFSLLVFLVFFFCHNKISSANHHSWYGTYFIWSAVQRKTVLGFIPVPKYLQLNSKMDFKPHPLRKPEFSSLMLAVGSKPDVASVLAIYKKTVTFNPKTTCMLNYFFKKQIWSRYLQG